MDSFLKEIFDVPILPESSTGFFKAKRHDQLLEIFSNWFRFASITRGCSINILNIQGLDDRGVDLIAEFSGKFSGRVGIQIKCDGDFRSKTTKFTRQVDNTLANYDTYSIDKLIIIFCADYTDRSNLTKAKREIAKIQQKRSAGDIFVVEAPKALFLLRKIFSAADFLDQFKDLKIPEFSITDIKNDDSGFPILVFKSKEFIDNPDSMSIAKAYILVIIGLVNPDILEPGFFSEGRQIIGTCPIDRSLMDIGISKNREIRIPAWFIRGLEEHGPINLWGAGGYNGGEELQLFLQLLMTQNEFERKKHYNFIGNKFQKMAERLKSIGQFGGILT